MQKVTVPNLLWYGNHPRDICFPERWDVDVLAPAGFSKPALDGAGIQRALEEPIGSLSLTELAAGKREAVIVFDDITRPTPVKDILPHVLEPLHAAGIPAANVRFIPALGTHGAMTNIDFRKKLGDDIVATYPIYNHNCFENCDYLGESASGVPVYVNREFMACDLRIGIGCITPHVHVGFGGGGKIVLPGIAGIETIQAFHGEVMARDPETAGLGRFEGNVMYKEIIDVVRMSGLQLKIDALLNDHGEITDLFVGDPVKAHLEGVAAAKEHYGTRATPGNDIVVVNSYAKYNEMAISMMMGLASVNFARGTVVLVVDAPEGQVTHYLLRSFGKEYGGRLYFKRGVPPETVKVIVCTAYPDRTMCDLFSAPEGIIITPGWDETLALLEADYPEGASVAVIPDGTMQYFEA